MARLPVPGPVVIPEGLEIKLVWSDGVGEWTNVLHGHLTAVGPISPGLAEQLFSAIKGQTGTAPWLAQLATTTEFTGVRVKDLRAAYNPEFLSSGAAAAGTGVGAPLSTNVALCVTERTGQAGRGFRGRVFLAGITVDGLSGPRQFDSATGAAAVAFMQGVMSALSTNQVPLVIGQRALAAGTDAAGNPLPARPADTVPVVSVEVADLRVDTQRRRLGR